SQDKPRLLFCAHIDAKLNTPGALDNAAGVATLLLLAELLTTHKEGLAVELLAMNGEDYYAASGELAYLADEASRLEAITLAVNIDGAGYINGQNVYSFYGCPDELAHSVQTVLSAKHGLPEGPSWFQSDHMVFAQKGVPAVALTTNEFAEFQGQIAHSPADTPEVVDGGQLVHLARALADLAATLARSP
ncbi:MAG: M28 family peptidase, partial [Candidatus Promineifilaceae bacterium]|nr:M28 family peptidase [Candidatus Promineifilaceae bacterium]